MTSTFRIIFSNLIIRVIVGTMARCFSAPRVGMKATKQKIARIRVQIISIFTPIKMT